MPPHVPRKRLRESSSEDHAGIKDKGVQSLTAAQRRKATLYDDLDAAGTARFPNAQSSSLLEIDNSESDSSLSTLSDTQFEDVPLAKRPKTGNSANTFATIIGGDEDGEDNNEDEDDDIEFEDVEAPEVPAEDAPVTSGDLELTLTRDSRISLTNPFGEKKGPSKWERKVRNATHRIHVMCLLWHNALRNSWLCDPEIQAIMVSHLPPRLWETVERWKRNSGLQIDETFQKLERKRKTKHDTKRSNKKSEKDESRDWGHAARKLDEGVIDMSHGDPLFRLMQPLVSWWKQRFRVTRPGLRKWGYMSLERLDRLTKAYVEDSSDETRFGERILKREDLRRCAQECQGSRDVGAQLFTALLRGLGLETRHVVNIQCLGFGWNKYEDAEPEVDDNSQVYNHDSKDKTPKKPAKASKTPNKGTLKTHTKGFGALTKAPRSSHRTSKQIQPIVVHDSDSLDLEYKDSDEDSVVELEVSPKKQSGSARKIDDDLEYPHCWTEVLSPVTKTYLPVDVVVKGTMATNRDLVESLEPRGAKADKARQVIAYVVGFCSDGTAKDVTVRYLKRRMTPGRTKGIRWPLSKIPVYNRHGKVKGYEHFDWFKTAMSGYRRGTKGLPHTEVDQQEDSTDLKPVQPEKKEIKEGEETLQYYKQSKEFVLERFLKREEALRPEATPVKVFKSKGKGTEVKEEDVYLRADVVPLKSAETWHKQGRAPIPGTEPLKRVPYRAATINRRREIMEAEATTGRKVLQGLYSFDQTDWIIPAPIENGIIPKNEYGNIDLFMEHMCPQGAVHIPFRGAVKVCKRLQIDYAEAVVDFEFGHRMAVPVIQGVVVAEVYHDQVMEQLQKDEAERARKEDEKRRKRALGLWRKFMMGMRIIKRIREDYGEIGEDVSVFGRGSAAARLNATPPKPAVDEDMAGGFLPEGFEVDDDGHGVEPNQQISSFFPVDDDEEDEHVDDTLILEDSRADLQQAEMQAETQAEKEVDSRMTKQRDSLASSSKQKEAWSKPKQTSPSSPRLRRRRRNIVPDDDAEDQSNISGESVDGEYGDMYDPGNSE